MPASERGLTLIEFAMGLVIIGILFAMGIPAFTGWMQNAQVRTAAESVLNGLQLARAEAVRRNAQVRFDLTDAAGGAAWSVGCVNVSDGCPAAIQNRSADEGGGKARVGVDTAAIPYPIPAGQFDTAIAAGTGLPAGITFDGMGRIPAVNVGADLIRIDVTHIANANARRMVVFVGAAGQVRMCDPALTGNPQGCS